MKNNNDLYNIHDKYQFGELNFWKIDKKEKRFRFPHRESNPGHRRERPGS